MMRLIPLVAVLALAACPAKPDDGKFGDGTGKPAKDNGTVGNKEIKPMPIDKPDFEHSVDVGATCDKGKLTVTLKIKPGYHAYAPGEEIGKPVELGVDAPWTVENVVIPAGTKRDLGPDLGKSVILEGDVPLGATVKGGTGDVKGAVMAQVCTDKACDRPKKHEFSVPCA
jgi:hypothetical protein